MTNDEIADLLLEAGRRHHQAFAASDGVDPEWPIFYGAFIQTRLFGSVEAVPTRSELVAVLVESDRMQKGSDRPWPRVFAERIHELLATS